MAYVLGHPVDNAVKAVCDDQGRLRRQHNGAAQVHGALREQVTVGRIAEAV